MTFLLPPGIKGLKYKTVADLSTKILKTLPTKQAEKSKVKLVKGPHLTRMPRMPIIKRKIELLPRCLSKILCKV